MDEYEKAITMYLGVSLEGWKEIQRYRDECKANIPLFDNLVEENAKLRGKVSFYEAHIKALEIVRLT